MRESWLLIRVKDLLQKERVFGRLFIQGGVFRFVDVIRSSGVCVHGREQPQDGR